MKKLIVANWKSNKTVEEARVWLEAFNQTSGHDQLTVAIAPSWPLLPVVAENAAGGRAVLAVQDLSPFPAGSYTGAVSARNLEGWPVKYAIVGHSERRRYFHETVQDIARKVEQAVTARITPIVCVDEGYIAEQAAAIEPELLTHCLVAHEHAATIGTGHGESLSVVKHMVAEVKHAFGEVPVLYGGSVDAFNVNEYLLIADGVLVGTASLEVAAFTQLLAATQQLEPA